MFRYSRPLSSYYRFFTPINRRCSETVHKPVRVKADRILQEQKQKIVNKKLLHEQIAQEHGKKLARVENGSYFCFLLLRGDRMLIYFLITS